MKTRVQSTVAALIAVYLKCINMHNYCGIFLSLLLLPPSIFPHTHSTSLLCSLSLLFSISIVRLCIVLFERSLKAFTISSFFFVHFFFNWIVAFFLSFHCGFFRCFVSQNECIAPRLSQTRVIMFSSETAITSFIIGNKVNVSFGESFRCKSTMKKRRQKKDIKHTPRIWFEYENFNYNTTAATAIILPRDSKNLNFSKDRGEKDQKRWKPNTKDTLTNLSEFQMLSLIFSETKQSVSFDLKCIFRYKNSSFHTHFSMGHITIFTPIRTSEFLKTHTYSFGIRCFKLDRMNGKKIICNTFFFLPWFSGFYHIIESR